jgi:hypothetical protein
MTMALKQPELEAALQTVPEHMHEGLYRYLNHGIRPGRFLDSLLCGNTPQALASADPANATAMLSGAWEDVLRALPPECHGSNALVDDWLDEGGLLGRAA